MSRVSTTKWNLLFSYTRTLIGLINGVLIVPLYLKYIDNSIFGFWLASGNILTWLTIVDPGVSIVLTQKVAYAFKKKNYKELSYIITSAFIISLTVCLTAFFISLMISFNLGSILNLHDQAIENELTFAFNINAVATCIILFSFCLSGTIFGLQKTKEIGIILTICDIIGISICVILLFNNFGILSIAYSTLIKSLFLFFLQYLILTFKLLKYYKINFHFNKRYFKSFINLFSFTFFSKLFGTLSSNIDLVIISRYLGPNAVMLLELTRRPIKLVQNFINTPSQSMLPALSNLYAEGDE